MSVSIHSTKLPNNWRPFQGADYLKLEQEIFGIQGEANKMLKVASSGESPLDKRTTLLARLYKPNFFLFSKSASLPPSWNAVQNMGNFPNIYLTNAMFQWAGGDGEEARKIRLAKLYKPNFILR